MVTLSQQLSKCPATAELEALLNEGLDANAAQKVCSHINGCPTCQSTLDKLTELPTDLLSSYGTVIADVGTNVGVTDETNEKRASLVPAETSELSETKLAVESSNDDSASNNHLMDVLEKMKSRGVPSFAQQPTRDAAIQFPGEPTSSAPLGTLDHYEILEAIGQGASGRLFRAHDTRLGRDVAIKVLHSELSIIEAARIRFDREGRAIAQLDNEHIVRVHAIESPIDFPPFIVMEYVSGESLGQRMKRDGVAEPRTASDALIQILAGLEVAHSAGVIHRDVKPGNVLVPNSGKIKLVDFGLARFEDSANADANRVTANCTIAGTPAYMSPEQVVEPSSVDHRADVFSAGVILFEMLTGELPFHGVPRMVLHQVVHEDIQSLRKLNDQIPRDLETICLKAVSREPQRRYQSAAEFQEDLIRWQQGHPIQARPVGRVEKLWRWKQRNPVVSSLLFVAIILVFGLVGVWLRYTMTITENYKQLAAANQALRGLQSKSDVDKQAAARNAKLAEQQANVAFDSINDSIFEWQDRLAHLDGTIELRRAMLQRAIKRLEKVAQTWEPAAPRLSLVVARNKLGDTWQHSNPDLALAAYRRALEDCDDALKDHPKSTAVLNCDIQTRLNIASAMMLQNQIDSATHQLRQADQQVHRAFQLLDDSDSTELRSQLADSQARIVSLVNRLNQDSATPISLQD